MQRTWIFCWVGLVIGRWACGTFAAPPPERRQSGGPTAELRGEVHAPPARGERIEDTLRVGDKAPDFTLSDPEGKRQVTLSDFFGKRPVVLIFGSYT